MKMKKRSLLSTVLFIVLMTMGTSLFAQDEGEGGDGVTFEYAKRTVINFDDDTIEGSLRTPDGQYLEVRKQVRHESLIRIRRHFKQSVLGSFSNL